MGMSGCTDPRGEAMDDLAVVRAWAGAVAAFCLALAAVWVSVAAFAFAEARGPFGSLKFIRGGAAFGAAERDRSSRGRKFIRGGAAFGAAERDRASRGGGVFGGAGPLATRARCRRVCSNVTGAGPRLARGRLSEVPACDAVRFRLTTVVPPTYWSSLPHASRSCGAAAVGAIIVTTRGGSGGMNGTSGGISVEKPQETAEPAGDETSSEAADDSCVCTDLTDGLRLS